MRVITAPTVEPVTLAEVRAQIGITDATDTSSDAIITRRITEARQWAEDYMQRALITQTQEVRLDSFYGRHARLNADSRCTEIVKLPFPNLLSVVSVKYIDVDGVEQTVSSADYVVDTHSLVGNVRPAYGVAWPATRDEGNAVRIQYTCGYGVAALDSAKTITGATNASPGVFTSAGHGFADGDVILLATTGMTTPNGLPYRVYAKATDTFQLANLSNNAGLSTVSWGTFTAGTAQKVELLVPQLVKEALLLLIGHWMNFQPQSENGASITRVPFAVRDIFDKYGLPQYA